MCYRFPAHRAFGYFQLIVLVKRPIFSNPYIFVRCLDEISIFHNACYIEKLPVYHRDNMVFFNRNIWHSRRENRLQKQMQLITTTVQENIFNVRISVSK